MRTRFLSTQAIATNDVAIGDVARTALEELERGIKEASDFEDELFELFAFYAARSQAKTEAVDAQSAPDWSEYTLGSDERAHTTCSSGAPSRGDAPSWPARRRRERGACSTTTRSAPSSGRAI